MTSHFFKGQEGRLYTNEACGKSAVSIELRVDAGIGSIDTVFPAVSSLIMSRKGIKNGKFQGEMTMEGPRSYRSNRGGRYR